MTSRVFSVFVSVMALCLLYDIPFAASNTSSIKIKLVVDEPALSAPCNIHFFAKQQQLDTTFRQNCKINTLALLKMVTQLTSEKTMLANAEQPLRVTVTVP